MKNKIFYLLAIAFLFTACDDEGFLDTFPRNSMNDETFWNTEGDAFGALMNCYSGTFSPNQPYKECRSDNSIQWYDWMDEGTRLIADGTITPYTSVTQTTWSDYYSAIRKCNFFLENVEKVPFTNSSTLNRMQAEARFLRAYTYLYAAFDFGDIPLALKTLNVEESKEILPSSQKQIYDFVVDEMNYCAGVLSADLPAGEFGRISKGICLAFKARTYLFQNDYANVLKSVQELEQLGKYALYTSGENPYYELFSSTGLITPETILIIFRGEQTGKLAAGHSTNAASLLKGVAEEDPYYTIHPAGSLVDAYPMADGRLIKEAGSTYNPKNPYINRDPRLANTIICPGDYYGRISGEEIVWDLLFDPEDEDNHWGFKYDFIYGPKTGYAWKKCLDWSAWGFRNTWNCKNDIILIRWADVLLMKAEALAETNGTGSLKEVIDIIDQLRDRCGGGKVHRENYTSKDDLIKLVRNERRVELANEGLRYFDLIRWRVAEKDPVTAGEGLNGDAFGAYMRLDGIGKGDRVIQVNGVPRRYAEKRVFDPSKRYLLPKPQNELDFNPNLKQNPGWE